MKSLLAFLASSALLVSMLPAQEPKPLASGRYECKSKAIFLVLNNGSVIENEERGRVALRELLSGESVDRFFTMIKNACQEASAVPPTDQIKPGKLKARSLLLKLNIKDGTVVFTLSAADLKGYSTLMAYLGSAEKATGCKQISPDCIRCPNGIIYCAGVESLK